MPITRFSTHRWDLSYEEARVLQSQLKEKIRLKPLALKKIRFVAGADIAVSKRLGIGIGAVVILSFPRLEVVETQIATAGLSFPYIPGLLSFREIPVLETCLARLATVFDLMLCDGQGIAHPRQFGLASHLGLILRIPTIGCAKSRLVGSFDRVGPRRGDYSKLTLDGKQVGSVLRTRDRVKPLFVSPGHLIDHPSCRRIVLALAPRYRIPEPTRLADQLVRREKRKLEG